MSQISRFDLLSHLAGFGIAVTFPAGFHVPDAATLALAQLFTNDLRTDATRKAYGTAAAALFDYVSTHHHVDTLDDVTPLHIGAWVEHLKGQGLATPSIKLRIAAVRRIFAWLSAFRVLDANPAAWIKTELHTVNKGKTPVLTGEEMARLLRSIDTSTLIGLRDRSMIATMGYSFARIGAITTLRIGDVFHQQNRLWLRLKEKRGRSIDVPCHLDLEKDLNAWLDAAGNRDDTDLPVFRSFDWASEAGDASTFVDADTGTRRRVLTERPMTQVTTWEMLQRRARDAGIATHVTCHTFRATGITAYLRYGGTLERAAAIAGHASMQTTKLYDRRSDHVTTDEIDKIVFA